MDLEKQIGLRTKRLIRARNVVCFAFNLLCVLFPHCMLVRIEMTTISSPTHRYKKRVMQMALIML